MAMFFLRVATAKKSFRSLCLVPEIFNLMMSTQIVGHSREGQGSQKKHSTSTPQQEQRHHINAGHSKDIKD